PLNFTDEATAIAVDNLGNVYVTGTSPGIGTLGDYATIKYDSNGVEQWVQRYNGPGNGVDKAVAIFVEPLTRGGNVYVTGESAGFDTGTDYATIKYSNTGVQQWAARYNNSGSLNDVASALIVDASGQVFVTGKSNSPNFYADYATVKYNASGVQQWAVRYDGPSSRGDEASAIAIDNSGNVYVTGKSDTAFYHDYVTIKYNAAGTSQWMARYRGVANFRNDEANALAVDNAGNVYVTGKSGDNSGYDDYATIKYNPAGVQQWVARYAGTNSDIAVALAVDSFGNILVAGTSVGSTSTYDYATIKYNSAGTEQWGARYEGPGNANSEAAALAIDNTGNIIVIGKSQGLSTGFDYATLTYSPAGLEQWPAARYHRGGSAVDVPTAVTVDGSGNIYVTGSSSGDYVTVKYNAAGVEQWAAPYNNGGTDEATAMAVDASGNVYVTGRSSNDYATVKYNSSGLAQWVVRYNGDGNASDGPTALALDAAGNIYVTGYSYGGASTNNDYVTIKYNDAGVELWKKRYNGPGNGSDSPAALAVDGEGNVYVTGTV
ncbi:MAG: SBBP repeat-containing protein, partial [Nitrososphaera sp.]